MIKIIFYDVIKALYTVIYWSKYTYLSTHMHTLTHAHNIYALTHTLKNSYPLAHTHTQAHSSQILKLSHISKNPFTHFPTQTHTNKLKYILTHIHSRVLTQTSSYEHIHNVHKHIHINKHAHTNVYA